MAKAIAIVAAFLYCTWAGFASAARLKKRAALLHAIAVAVQKLLISMEYAKLPLSELLRRKLYGDAQILFDCFASYLDGGADAYGAWRGAKRELPGADDAFASLTDADWAMLGAFMQELGTTDGTAQRESGLLLRSGIAEAIAEADDLYNKRGRLYRTMGLLCGAAISILLL